MPKKNPTKGASNYASSNFDGQPDIEIPSLQFCIIENAKAQMQRFQASQLDQERRLLFQAPDKT